jgi:predicted dehydrogenase
VRCAVVGTGHLGRIHANLIRKIESETGRLKLVAVVDSNESRREAIASQLRVQACADLQQVVDQIDAAVIATPTITHKQIGAAVLNRGKHCFIEKPLALDMLECKALIELAKVHHVKLQVGHVENFNPVWTGTRDRLRDVRFVDAVRCGTYTGRSTDIGVVMDLMIHDLDLVAELIDAPVERVCAFGMKVLSEREDFAEANIQFQNGAIARLRASRIDEEMCRSMSVYAHDTTAHLNFTDGSAKICNCEQAGKNNADALPYEERSRVKESLFTNWMPTEVHHFDAINAIEQELLDFAESIETGCAPQVHGERGLRAVTMAEQVLAAIEHSKWQLGQYASEHSPVYAFPQYVGPQRIAA